MDETDQMSEEEKQSAHFLSLLLSLNQTALVALGKLKNPITDDWSPDLDEAQNTIDLLAMLKVKTKGNVDSSEGQLLDSILADLRMHYVAVVSHRKGGAKPEKPRAAEDPGAATR